MRHSLRYVAIGAASGLGYALLNNAMDYWHNHGVVARAFVALHDVVDDLIPVLIGSLLGIALYLRSKLARQERARAEGLRERLQHVERDQAVWVVAAATLHELKNPLHTLGLLLEELEAEDKTGLAARMRKQMDRALVPLDSLRDMARCQRGGGESYVPTPEHHKLASEVVENVLHDLGNVTRERGVSLALRGQLPSSLRVDPNFLRIILENLIGNSLDGLPPGGHIEVQLDPSTSTISVCDDGPGIPDAAVETLFRPLETAKAGGLGLGLSIARALARAMKGDLVATRRGDWATTFELVLPSPA